MNMKKLIATLLVIGLLVCLLVPGTLAFAEESSEYALGNFVDMLEAGMERVFAVFLEVVQALIAMLFGAIS